MAPTRTLYVDSSYAEVDSSGGRFKLSLPDAIVVPANTRCYIDDCIFPYSWQTVLAGVNDRAYVLSEKRNGVIWTGAWAFSDPFLAPSDTQLAGTWTSGGETFTISNTGSSFLAKNATGTTVHSFTASGGSLTTNGYMMEGTWDIYSADHVQQAGSAIVTTDSAAAYPEPATVQDSPETSFRMQGKASSLGRAW